MQVLKNFSYLGRLPPKFLIFWVVGLFLATTIYLGDLLQLKWYLKFDLVKYNLDSTPATFVFDSLKGYLIKTPGCSIPNMDPFHSSVKDFILTPSKIICNDGLPPLFDSNLTSIFRIPAATRYYDISKMACCYQPFTRKIANKNQKDKQVTYDAECHSFDGRAVHITDEFVKLLCTSGETKIYEDYFAFVPLKTKKTVPQAGIKKPDVLIVGLDTVSRVNFYRQMPRTANYINELNGIELMGYNKVADNTFLNLMPVLAGMFESELQDSCWPNKNDHFDNCPFLWQNFSSLGYTTAFAEDCAWMGIYNFQKNGFSEQPVDYYYSPFDWTAIDAIGNNKNINCNLCMGAREDYVALINYAEKFVRQMRNNSQPYFGFFWESSLTHDYLNFPSLGDWRYYNFLKQLKENGDLDNTILIFMSDHGIRWGDIRKTYQGQLEERLPFVFIVLPDWIKYQYPIAVTTLRKNSRKLTTPFDLHETLKNFLDLNSLNRIKKPTAPARGYSLFSEIPANRTCEDAAITSHWCTCQQSVEVPINNTQVIEAATFTVSHINGLLKGYAECAPLKLDNIQTARLLYHEGEHIKNSEDLKDFTIVFGTIPSNAIFEATVRFVKNVTDSITGSISRLNLYGKQSLCMTDYHLKLYCYCSKLLMN
ncbi:hypothetical protein GWI33_020323 [Rhynchophorus ferrugineus]|uniref:DUF229 domain containing protein n=1 Tax=Rhynchophorus ferrugineus TaxID=354439 RepID=A0A834LZI4_RHYFE|nr:hypothetical protein GWI33_020323 [Rhynchophorus ferrugineus]